MLLALSFLVALVFHLLNKQNTPTKIAFLLISDIFLFCFAINLVNQTRIINNKIYYGNIISDENKNDLLVTVNNLPLQKGDFIKCELKVREVKSEGEYKIAQGKIIAYFKNSELSKQISFGQTLLIHSKLLEVDEPKNPFEFNYKTYLQNQQIFHTCFVDSTSFSMINTPSAISSIWKFGLKVKQHVLSKLKQSNLSADAYAISAALLTGYDDEIDKQLMEAFSHSGTLHVLSVSGLHTGLIYLVLAFLFDLIDRNKKQKLLKFIFITICLWAFALITGFSAPVLRAVIMFNLLGLGNIYFRNNYKNQINILLVSAFMLLCYDPFLISNIGFQLSYFALIGIIFYTPVFENIWQPQNKLTAIVWSNICASFAATLTTLPFTLFYFKQFPLWFFICNLIVVPATFIVLLLAVFIILNFSKASLIINPIIKFLTAFIQMFNLPSAGYIDNIHFNWLDSLLMSAFILLFSAAIYYKSYKQFVYTLLLVIVWQINGIMGSYEAKSNKLFTVYNVKHQSVCSVKNGTQVILDSVSHNNFNYHIKPHLVSFSYPKVNTSCFNLLKSKNANILILRRNNYWPLTDYQNISSLLISNNFELNESDLEQFHSLKLVIADGSNNKYISKQNKQLCSKFGVEYYSTAEQGAYLLNL